jgi:hypothetical protein
MGTDDLLCSRNAREEKGRLVVLLLTERARSECARSTRAIEDRPAHPSKRKAGELGGSIDGYVLEMSGTRRKRTPLVGRAQWEAHLADSQRSGYR